jgi:hypothetical protein
MIEQLADSEAPRTVAQPITDIYRDAEEPVQTLHGLYSSSASKLMSKCSSSRFSICVR